MLKKLIIYVLYIKDILVMTIQNYSDNCRSVAVLKDV